MNNLHNVLFNNILAQLTVKHSSLLYQQSLVSAIKTNQTKTGVIKKKTLNYEANVFCILIVSFYMSNTYVTLLKSTGEVLSSKSAGCVGVGGKQKTNRHKLVQNLLLLIKKDLNTLLENSDVAVALYLYNVGSEKKWVTKLTKKLFLITSIKLFDLRPYNGCRKKKVRRRKLAKTARR